VPAVTEISTLGLDIWTPGGETAPPGAMYTPAARLESGEVLYFPRLPFPTGPDEAALFSPGILASAKNASFDPATGRVGGTAIQGDDLIRLASLMRRFSDAADSLVNGLLVPYRGKIERARASFRPAEIAGRSSSWRKDDTRLHVDSFPATPVQGRRILRLFTNVNPAGKPRTWRIGGDFEQIAKRFAGAISMPWPGSAAVLRAIHVTKSRRSQYDALMLQLHDRMKEDEEFQKTTPQVTFDFPSGSTWLTFTDAVPHAAMAGQYQLEQTFLVPVNAMIDPSRSPLRILEGLKGCSLV
jgi:3-deoxy-D-manno-oct-2-ulosonic acid (Kdo) hydroxylase